MFFYVNQTSKNCNICVLWESCSSHHWKNN